MTTHGATDLELAIAKAIAEVMRLDLYRVSLSDRLGAVHSLAAIPITGTDVDDDLTNLGGILDLFGESPRIEAVLEKVRVQLLTK
jgi:hypothetical protein